MEGIFAMIATKENLVQMAHSSEESSPWLLEALNAVKDSVKELKDAMLRMHTDNRGAISHLEDTFDRTVTRAQTASSEAMRLLRSDIDKHDESLDGIRQEMSHARGWINALKLIVGLIVTALIGLYSGVFVKK
jgi:hypothetical protein